MPLTARTLSTLSRFCVSFFVKWADRRDSVVVNWGAPGDCNQRLRLSEPIPAPVHDMGSRKGINVV